MWTVLHAPDDIGQNVHGDREEMTVPRVLGPTIPRWELGARIRQFRTDRDPVVEQADLAKEVGCSESKIQKIEKGDVKTSKGDLRIIMDVLDLDEGQRKKLEELRSQGEQRGWWARFGQLPAQFATYLDLEASAEEMQVFEPLLIHGLFQTEEYARASARSLNGPVPEEDAERQVQIKLGRQRSRTERSGNPDISPLRLWVVLDEAVLHRPVGGAEVMRGQLQRLLSLPAHEVTLQIVPYEAGEHPGLMGALTIFRFDPDLHSPVAYAEMALGAVFAERADEIEQSSMRYSHITAAALSPERSRELIRSVADTL